MAFTSLYCTLALSGQVAKAARIRTINPDGVVTATDRKGRAFMFRVTSPVALQALKSGQTVMVDPAKGKADAGT